MLQLDQAVAAAVLAVGNMGFLSDPIVEGTLVRFESNLSSSVNLAEVPRIKRMDGVSQYVLDCLIASLADSDETEAAFCDELSSWRDLLSTPDWDRDKIVNTWPYLTEVFSALDLAFSKGVSK